MAIKLFYVTKKYKRFLPGEAVKINDEKPRQGDYIIIKTKNGYKLTKYHFFLRKSDIIGKVYAVLKNI